MSYVESRTVSHLGTDKMADNMNITTTPGPTGKSGKVLKYIMFPKTFPQTERYLPAKWEGIDSEA